MFFNGTCGLCAIFSIGAYVNFVLLYAHFDCDGRATLRADHIIINKKTAYRNSLHDTDGTRIFRTA